MERKNETNVNPSGSKEQAKEENIEVKSDNRKEVVSPWDNFFFGGRREVPPHNKDSQQTEAKGNDDSNENDEEKNGFSWI